MTYGLPAVTVVYSVNTNHDLVRTVNGVPGTAARGVTGVVFSAAGCYATVTIQPPVALQAAPVGAQAGQACELRGLGVPLRDAA